jgi:hypothetical protein
LLEGTLEAGSNSSMVTNSSTDDYTVVYGDVLAKATATYCILATGAAAVIAQDDENKYRRITFMWRRLKSVCGDSNANDCLKKEGENALRYAASSEIRDVNSVNGRDKIRDVPRSIEKAGFSSPSTQSGTTLPYLDWSGSKTRLVSHK